MAYYFQLTGAALEAYRTMLADLREKAMRELKLGPNDIVVRPIRPEDLGLSTPEWTFNIASGTAWNTMINAATISADRFVGINGVLLAESGELAVSQLKITRMGQVKRYWQIQGVNYLEDAVIFFDDPITVDQKTPITIEGYGVTTDSAFKCIFLGAVAERKGMLIT